MTIACWRLTEAQANGWVGAARTRKHLATRIFFFMAKECFVTDSTLTVVGHITASGHFTVYPEPRPTLDYADISNKPEWSECVCQISYHPDCKPLGISKWGRLGNKRHHPLCQWAPSVFDNWSEIKEEGAIKTGWNSHESDMNTRKFANIHEAKEQDNVDFIINSGKMSAQRGLEIFTELQTGTVKAGKLTIREDLLVECVKAGLVDDGVLVTARLKVLADRMLPERKTLPTVENLSGLT